MNLRLNPTSLTPPGDKIDEVLKSKGITIAELSEITSLSLQTIHEIRTGLRQISYSIGEKLELATGIHATFWMNISTLYMAELDRSFYMEIREE